MAPPRRLTDEQYDDIALAYRTSESLPSIAARFGIAKQTVQYIAKRRGVALRRERTAKQRIIQASLNHPELGPTAIAEMVGASLRHAERVRQQCGLRLQRENKFAKILEILAKLPNATTARVAWLAGTDRRYVRKVRRERNNITSVGTAIPNQGGIQSVSG